LEIFQKDLYVETSLDSLWVKIFKNIKISSKKNLVKIFYWINNLSYSNNLTQNNLKII
jgi:hypothetical protein